MGQWDNSIGVLLLGLFINTYLYGLVSFQFISYYNAGFKDPLWIRVMVVVCVYAAWDMCVTHYGDPSFLLVVTWIVPFTAVSTAFIAMISQSYLIHRLYMLTKNRILVASCVGLQHLCLCFWVLLWNTRCVKYFDRLSVPVAVWLGSQTIADVIITISLITVLLRSRTGFRRTDTVVNRLIRGAVQTGFFVSLFAMADLFGFLFDQSSNLYSVFAMPIGRIYTNTLMDTLNARAHLKTLGISPVDLDSETNPTSIRLQNSSKLNTSQNPHTMHSVQVQQGSTTETEHCLN
ncbi:hypothetical protein F5887DRAFT_1058222 [Amanita rubescens]|nr:hypothetical protein F5887DRAFT_1058222 [Amanita rubescens]